MKVKKWKIAVWLFLMISTSSIILIESFRRDLFIDIVVDRIICGVNYSCGACKPDFRITGFSGWI